MKVAVLGAGAIGGWLAAALSEAGVAVSIAAHGDTLAALRERGLRLTRDGLETTFRLPVGTSAELGAQDLLIVATKGQDVARALPDILPLLHAGTTVVSALNGLPWWFTQDFPGPLNNVALDSVDPGGRVAAAIAPQRAVGCVIHASIRRTAPACIQVGKIGRLILGEPAGHHSERVGWLTAACASAGVTATASDNIRLEIWSKLWGNMNMNPISALTRAPTARVLGDPEVRTLCLRMMEEMAQAGSRIGLPLDLSANDRIAVTQRLGGFRTSMLDDLERGAALEYAPLLGAVVEIAQRVGVPTPFCETVLALIRQLSQSISDGG